MYDRSEAAMRRIIARAQENDEVGKLYVHLAKVLMKSARPSSSWDRALKRLADSCDDAMPMLDKAQQTPGHLPLDPSSSRQRGR